MTRPSLLPVFFVALAAAAVFILVSGQSLPSVVASHFAADGRANGFMSRDAYLGVMMAVAVGVPLFLVLIPGLVRLAPPHLINLPNREYWLAPERITDTFAFLRNHGVYLAALLSAFLCFTHWLVVGANRLRPPHLSDALFVTGLAIFLLAVTLWTVLLIVHFRRRP